MNDHSLIPDLGLEHLAVQSAGPGRLEGAAQPPQKGRGGPFRLAGSGRHLVLLLSCTFLLTATFACSRPKQRYKPPVLATRGDVVDYVRDLLEHEDPDVRRGAIEQLARTRHRDLPGVLDALALAAWTDESESVRRAALNALAKLSGGKALDTALVLLGAGTDETEIRLPDDELRFEAVQALRRLVEADSCGEELGLAVRDTAIRLLETDRSRDVRLCAARILGCYPTPESLEALITALRQGDFGVVYAAEQSLISLTGQTHDRDPAGWAKWARSTEDPFAARGSRSETTDSKRKHRWWPW